MGLRDLLREMGYWTDVFKWSEPSLVRVRLRGDWWLRLAIAIGAGGAGTCLLLVLFAINVRPPNPAFALIGGGIAFAITAGLLFHGSSSASGRVRVCQEGIQRKRNYAGITAQCFEEANWEYASIEHCVIVPGHAIGKRFSVLLVGGGGEWEMVGVPQHVDLQQLANFLASRRIAVSSAALVPPQFTRSINMPVSLAMAAMGMLLFVGGLGFYAVKMFGRGAPQVAQGRPPAAIEPVEVPDPRLLPVAPLINPAAAGNRVNEAPPDPPAGNPPAGIAAIPERPPVNAPAVAPAGVPVQPAGAIPAAVGPRIPDRPAFAAGGAGNANAAAGHNTEVAGGPGGFPFQSTSKTGEPLIGLAWTTGNWGGKQVIGRLEPMFARELPRGFQSSVVARDGYAVGGISVEGEDFVRAIELVFVRVKADGTLDPADSYTSEWIGHPAGQKIRAIDSRGARVIGIQGRRAAIVDAVGLVLAE